jgi:hypothetical protein
LRIRADPDNHSAELVAAYYTNDPVVLVTVQVAMLVEQMLTSYVADDVIVTVDC